MGRTLLALVFVAGAWEDILPGEPVAPPVCAIPCGEDAPPEPLLILESRRPFLLCLQVRRLGEAPRAPAILPVVRGIPHVPIGTFLA